jgi:hypothetical protein
MVSVPGAVRVKADITGKFPFCTNIDDTDKDDPAGYGSFWITQVGSLRPSHHHRSLWFQGPGTRHVLKVSARRAAEESIEMPVFCVLVLLIESRLMYPNVTEKHAP